MEICPVERVEEVLRLALLRHAEEPLSPVEPRRPEAPPAQPVAAEPSQKEYRPEPASDLRPPAASASG